MAIIKYKDKDGKLQPLGATGDHSHSLESLGAAAKDHPHDVATAEKDGFMSKGDKAALDKAGKDIDAINTTLANVGTVTEYVTNEVSKEKARAEEAEGALDTRLDKIEGDYLTSTNQTALEEAIAAAETSAVDTILGCAEGETVSADYDTLKKVADWIAADTENNGKLDGRIKKIEDDYLTSANEKALSKTIGENTASIGSIQKDMDTKVSQEAFNALSAIVDLPSGTITEYVSGEIKNLEIDKYAEDKDLAAATDRIDALEKLPQADATKETSGFMSADDKKKLDGIAENANNYKHPGHTAAESDLYKVTVDSEGHVTNVTKVEKSDITGLGIPAKNTEYNNATTDVAGLMSSDDKTALDAISTWIGDIGDDNFSEIVADIESQIAGKVPQQVKENVDFNELKDPGFYIVHSSTQNKPDSNTGQYSLIVVKSDKSEKAGHQIAIPYSYSSIYIRAFIGTSWYNWKQISLSDHTHSYAGSSTAGGAATSANKVNNSLTIQLNGGETEDTNKFTFDGSGAKTLDIKPSTIGALSAETKSSGTFDEITTPGVWSVSNSVTGGPVSKKYYTVIVGRSTANSSTWLHQIAIIESSCEMYIRYKNSDGWKTWQKMPYNAMTGATSSAAGSSGVVPAPSKGEQNKFLKGNGSWSDLPTASTTAAGMMSTDDKTTLDAIDKWVGDTSSNFATIMTGYASSSHGNHVPTTEAANNAKFLRNDNTWQTVTPGNIGALTATTISSGSFNDIKKPGIYAINGINTHAPTTSSYWTLIVGTSRNQTGNYVHQIAIREGSYDMYIRYFNSSSWSGWVKIKPDVMTGASSASVGIAGLVPQPAKGNQDKFLKGDGTWADPPDTNTHYESKNVVTNTSTANYNTGNVSNGNVRINSVENGAVTSSHKITGSGATTVTTDSNGNIVISSTDNNTVYAHPTTAGNKHIPAGGQSGKFLGYGGESGTATWVDAPSANVSTFNGTNSGLVPQPASTNQTSAYVLRGDGAWGAVEALQAHENTANKLFLVGVSSNGNWGWTFSNQKCYTEGGHLYSNNSQVVARSNIRVGKITGIYLPANDQIEVNIQFNQTFESLPVVTLNWQYNGDINGTMIGVYIKSLDYNKCTVVMTNSAASDRYDLALHYMVADI